jgi:hypothetical protein
VVSVDQKAQKVCQVSVALQALKAIMVRQASRDSKARQARQVRAAPKVIQETLATKVLQDRRDEENRALLARQGCKVLQGCKENQVIRVHQAQQVYLENQSLALQG